MATAKNDGCSQVSVQRCNRFGIPDKISSDSGTRFVNTVLKTITEALCVKHTMGCVYHPQSQGTVERADGVLKEKIAKNV